MPHILIFEGTDGSGKSTTIHNFVQRLETHGKTYQLITKDNDPLTRQITEVYFKKPIADEVEICLRLARELVKTELIDRSVDVVVIDRGLISIVSSIIIFGLSLETFAPIASVVVAKYGEFNTIFCCPPYHIARKRVKDKVLDTGGLMSKNESRGDEYNMRLYQVMLGLIIEPLFIGKGLLRVDTHKMDEDTCADAVYSYIYAAQSKG